PPLSLLQLLHVAVVAGGCISFFTLSAYNSMASIIDLYELLTIYSLQTMKSEEAQTIIQAFRAYQFLLLTLVINIKNGAFKAR
ncbi:hypothetical protein Q7I66_22420, partial [Escherichia coli]|uniref:hypothetical protein n=1 Tax=Escherichia coli TaxID=562 RepID=UPI003EE6B9F5